MTNESVLVCHPEAVLETSLLQHKPQNCVWEFAHSGKAAQSLLYKQKYALVMLDIDLQNHSAIEVIRYIKVQKPSLRIVLMAKSQERLEEVGLDKKELQRLGIVAVLYYPLTVAAIQNQLDELNKLTAWKNVKEVSYLQHGSETNISDTKFTRIPLKEFYVGAISVFDIYLRQAPGRYQLLFCKGESVDGARLEQVEKEKKHEWLYFLTSERAAYINYLNEISNKVTSSPSYSPEQKVGIVKSIADQYLSEIYTKGFKSEAVSEGKKLCENILRVAKDDVVIRKLLVDFEMLDPKSFSESFLVAFFASMIVSRMPWGTKNIVEKVVLGALLHDIGKMKFPASMKDKIEKQLNAAELKLYKEHPKFGVEMLDLSAHIPEAVKQIVYQHHEAINGAGYPNQLTGFKIFPLAKIVSFADGLVEFLQQENLGAVEGTRQYLRTPGKLELYDPIVIKTFLTCFVDKDKARKGKVA